MPEQKDDKAPQEEKRDWSKELYYDSSNHPESGTRHVGSVPEQKDIDPDSEAGKYLSQPEQAKNHSYLTKEERPDGTVVYYYGNGVKAIHHPKIERSPVKYHDEAAQGHLAASNKLRTISPEAAQAHLNAALGHGEAIKAKQSVLSQGKREDDPKNQAAREKSRARLIDDVKSGKEIAMSKSTTLDQFISFLKEDGGGGAVAGVGTVAVSSDPGVFTPTYGGNSSKKNKQKRSGVDKLDRFLRDSKKVEKWAADIVNSAASDLRKEDDELEKLAVLARMGAAVAGSKLKDEVLGNEDVEKAGSDLPRQAVIQEPAKPAKTETEEKVPEETTYKSTDEEFNAFYDMFKEYFEYFEDLETSKAEDADDRDSRNSEARTDSEEESRTNMD